MEISGVQINYYFICKRKLWFFSHQIGMEQESELVKIGSSLHKFSMQKIKAKEINFEKMILDNIDSHGIIHEVKKSKKMKIAHIFQVLYYLMLLKNQGIKTYGVIHYLEDNSKENVFLNEDNERKLKDVLNNIQEIISKEQPPKESKKKICKKCSYFSFCWC